MTTTVMSPSISNALATARTRAFSSGPSSKHMTKAIPCSSLSVDADSTPLTRSRARYFPCDERILTIGHPGDRNLLPPTLYQIPTHDISTVLVRTPLISTARFTRPKFAVAQIQTFPKWQQITTADS